MIRRGFIVALACSLPGAAAAQNVTEVQVAPPTVTIRVGERSGLLATAFDRIGNVIPTVRIIWSSNNVNVAKVDNNGTVTGVANGVAIIEARVGTRRGQAAVQVTGGSAPAPPPGPPPAAPPPAAPLGRGERRSKRKRRSALARSGHDPGDRLGRWRAHRDRAGRRPAGGVHGAGGLAPDAFARRDRYAACDRRRAE